MSSRHAPQGETTAMLWFLSPGGGDAPRRWIDPIVAHIDDRTAERNRLGADRHAAEISVEIDAGEDSSRAGAQRRADLLPVVAVAALDRRTCRRDQVLVRFA